MERQAWRAVRLADRAGMARLGRQGRNGLMIAAAAQHRFDDALTHGWTVYRRSRGNVIDEGEVLQNLGEVCARAGHAVAARAAFATVVSRELPARIVLPALGGLARTGAATGQETTARWATRQVARCARTSVPKYALASALLECSTALISLGEPRQAERFRQAALALGLKHKFYEISYKADELRDLGRTGESRGPASLADRGASIAEQVTSMEPSRLPRHVMLAAGSE